MARKLRRNEIDLAQTRVYHVVSRCVRSLRLLDAQDELRKELCLQHLQLLSEATAVQVAGFSLMGNHLHLLLRVDVERAESWSAKEVALQWLKLHPVRNGYFQPIEPTEDQIDELVENEEWVETTREKLCSISQFMKELKQRIAQSANRQDRVTGAFWEGRYKIKAVEDEVQLLATMAYIDLNPFAADVCKTPEEGRYTSLQGRLGRDKPKPVAQVRPAYESKGKAGKNKDVRDRSIRQQTPQQAQQSAANRRKHDQMCDVRQPSTTWLLPLDDQWLEKQVSKVTSRRRRRKGKRQVVLPGLTVRVYLNLVDTVARLMRGGKKRLSQRAKPILERLSLTPDRLALAVCAMRDHWALQVAELPVDSAAS